MSAQRRAVVTGAASGIGAAVAAALIKDGMEVVGLDINPCEGFESVEIDLGDLRKVDALSTELDDVAPVDVLVSCAGIFESQFTADFDHETYDRTLRINLHAPVILMSRLAPRMAQRGYGRIVVVTSIHTTLSEPGGLAYDVSKGGLDGAVRTLAIEHSEQGVLVNAVAPGFIRTGMSIINGENELESAWFVDNFVKAGRIPMRRPAEPTEVASAVAYLASEQNTYVNATSLLIDGGLSARL